MRPLRASASNLRFEDAGGGRLTPARKERFRIALDRNWKLSRNIFDDHHLAVNVAYVAWGSWGYFGRLVGKDLRRSLERNQGRKTDKSGIRIRMRFRAVLYQGRSGCLLFTSIRLFRVLLSLKRVAGGRASP